jgi:hypothetical protein
LNWRYHKKFNNPGGMQWEHIVEQSSGIGENSVTNLALTSAALNAQFNVFFSRKYTPGEISGMPGTGGKSLRAFLKGQGAGEHRKWKEKCYAIFGVGVKPMANERGAYQILG